MDPVRNFAKVNVSGLYNDTDTLVTLTSGQVSELPVPATEGAFDLVWWDVTSYDDPADDPNVEIVRVTDISGDDLTIVRGQQGTSPSTKNTPGSEYKMILAFTKGAYDFIVASIQTIIQGSGTLLDLDESQQSDDSILYETEVKGGKLSDGNAIRVTIPISAITSNTGDATFNLIYGSTTIASFRTTFKNNEPTAQKGFIEAYIYANASTTAQKGIIRLLAGRNEGSNGASGIGLSHGSNFGTATEDSSNDLMLQVTCSAVNTFSVTAEGAIFEILSDASGAGAVGGNQVIPVASYFGSSSDGNIVVENIVSNLDKMFAVIRRVSSDISVIFEYVKDPITKNYYWTKTSPQIVGSSGVLGANLELDGSDLYVIANADIDPDNLYRYNANDITVSPVTVTLSEPIVSTRPFVKEGNNLWTIDIGSAEPTITLERWQFGGTYASPTLTKQIDTKDFVLSGCDNNNEIDEIKMIGNQIWFSYRDSTGRMRIAVFDFASGTLIANKYVFNDQTSGPASFGSDSQLVGFGYAGGATMEYIYSDRGRDYAGGGSDPYYLPSIIVQAFSVSRLTA